MGAPRCLPSPTFTPSTQSQNPGHTQNQKVLRTADAHSAILPSIKRTNLRKKKLIESL